MGQLPPAVPELDIQVAVLAGPSAVTLVPVQDSQGKPIIMRLSSDGHFDGGVGIVPEVADRGIATFEIFAWGGELTTPLSPEFRTTLWTQMTGSWDPAAVPPAPMAGPPLQAPEPMIYRGSINRLAVVPSTTSGPLDQWTPRTSGTDRPLSSIVCGNHTFVAVGAGGMILTSPDGANWTSAASRYYIKGCYKFVAVFVWMRNVGGSPFAFWRMRK